MPRAGLGDEMVRQLGDVDSISPALSLYDEPVRVLLCTNGSVERDGTRRKFGLTIPASIDDPIHAAAWTFDWPVAAYRAAASTCCSARW